MSSIFISQSWGTCSRCLLACLATSSSAGSQDPIGIASQSISTPIERLLGDNCACLITNRTCPTHPMSLTTCRFEYSINVSCLCARFIRVDSLSLLVGVLHALPCFCQRTLCGFEGFLLALLLSEHGSLGFGCCLLCCLFYFVKSLHLGMVDGQDFNHGDFPLLLVELLPSLFYRFAELHPLLQGSLVRAGSIDLTVLGCLDSSLGLAELRFALLNSLELCCLHSFQVSQLFVQSFLLASNLLCGILKAETRVLSKDLLFEGVNFGLLDICAIGDGCCLGCCCCRLEFGLGLGAQWLLELRSHLTCCVRDGKANSA